MVCIEEVLGEAARQAPVPGLAISVFDGTGTVASLVHGVADRTTGRPVREDLWWDLASLTKVLATLPEVLRLIDSGELDPDRPLGASWARAAHAPVGDASPRRLLCYDAGLPWWLPFYQAAGTPEEVFARVLATPLERPPGSGPVYTDIGFILLGRLVEDLTGVGLDELVARRGWLSMRPPVGDCVATEFCPWRGRLLVGEVHDENAAALGGVAGHAGAFGTMAGVVGAARAVLNRAVVSPRLHEQSERCWSSSAVGERFGLGWWLAPTRGIGGPHPGPGSFGAAGFVGNRLWFEPAYGYGVLVLSNRVHPTRGDVTPFRQWHGRLLDAVGRLLR